MAKIKHNELTNQADLHNPKYHGISHQKGEADQLNVETLATNNAAPQNKVLKAKGSNELEWNESCKLDGDLTLHQANDHSIILRDNAASVTSVQIGVKNTVDTEKYTYPLTKHGYTGGLSQSDLFGYTYRIVVNARTSSTTLLEGIATSPFDNSGFELPKVKWSQNKQEAQKYATEKDAKEMWLALGGKKHNYTIYQEVE